MNLILCGLPGSGKSTVGKILAKEKGYKWIDTDALIEIKFQKSENKTWSCRQIFSQKGPSYFRELEHQVIKELLQNCSQKVVISLGGGVIENRENISLLQSFGNIIYLSGEIPTLFQRAQKEGLPAYLDPNDPYESFHKIASSRMAHYHEAADIEVKVDELTPEEIAFRLSLPIYFGTQLLTKILRSLKTSHNVIITDSIVEPLYGKQLEKYLNEQGFPTSLISFPTGEEFKTRETKEYCENQLLKLGADRQTCVIGLGGGVVLDIAGFVAATYCRGVPSLLIPTSLLAMVDASIGGKTGVNVPEGKNMIGTITQPKAIFIDPEMLKTLPLPEIKNGIAEMIKHSLIQDRTYFNFLKLHAKEILTLPMPLLKEAIWKSILIKSAIVKEDEFETGKRRLLNLGHTFAHALETASDYTIAHGRAVAIGILAECQLAYRLNYLEQSACDEIRSLFEAFGIDLTLPKSLNKNLYDLMKRDKKGASQSPRFVLLKEIGVPLPFDGQYCIPIDENILKKLISF